MEGQKLAPRKDLEAKISAKKERVSPKVLLDA